jgi:hypothetical protein
MSRKEFTGKTKREQESPFAKRIAWVKARHAKQLADYHFANGYRAGLECALLAIEEGRDVLGYSVDTGEAKII